MEISLKAKYNVGDSLLYYSTVTSKLEEFKVRYVNFNVYADKTEIFYFNEIGSCKLESNLFASKEEFINQL